MNKYIELKGLVNSLEYEMRKFDEKKVKASALRVRAGLLSAKKLCDQLRKDIQTELRVMPTRSKAVSIPAPSKLERQTSMHPDSSALPLPAAGEQ